MITFCLLILFSTLLFAQKGVPPPELTNAEVNTNYPQHEDFKPSLVNRLHVPPGFEVFVAASGLGDPRMMAVSADGSLYITRRDVGDVLLLKDRNGDGRFDDLRTIIANYRDVHGIVIHDGRLYVCSDKKLARGRINNDGSVGALDTLANDLPDGGRHDNRTLAFGPDGKLYISVGSDCNDCKETNPEHATILQADAGGTNRRIYARNLRNTIGFDWSPETGVLWGMDHDTDWRGDTIPPEELNKIIDGGDYGSPLVYGRQQVDYTREDPVDATKEQYALTTVPAVLTFPAHSAPMNFHSLFREYLPAAYRNDALVTWHGSWNRKNPEGFKVQRIKFHNGEPQTAVDFLTGFFNAGNRTRFGRPVGLALSDDGMIYISDDANGVIYCVRRINHQHNAYSKK